MADYIILTDSSCDLPQSMADEASIVAIPLSVTLEGVEYANHLDEREISSSEFYGKLRQGAEAKTSAVNTDAFVRAMGAYLDVGEDILYLGFSSGLSATYGAGETAAKELRKRYPDRKILTVDTLCASMGQGLLVYLTAKMRDGGATIEAARDYAEATKLKICHTFTVDDLHHLKRGGRLSGTATVIGSLLKIKPVLRVDDEGKLVKQTQVRGRKASLAALLESMREKAVDPKGQTVFISHGDSDADAEYLADEIRKAFGPREVVLSHIGPVIGAHTGAGGVALFFVGKGR